MLRKAPWHSVEQTRTSLRRVVTTAALVVGLILLNAPPQSEAQQQPNQPPPQTAAAAGFSCTRSQCTCSGLEDCFDLAGIGLCKGKPSCGGNTCICNRASP